MGPHYGLRIRLKADIYSVNANDLRRPTNLDVAIIWAEKHGFLNEHGTHLTEEEATQIANKVQWPDTEHSEIDDYYKQLGPGHEAEQITRNYVTWSQIAEVRMLALRGIEMHQLTKEQLEPLLGRGQMPLLEDKPAFQSSGKVEELSWLLGMKECGGAGDYSIICYVVSKIATRKAEGQEANREGREFLRYITTFSGGSRTTAMIERAVRATIDYEKNNTEDIDRIDTIMNMTKFVKDVSAPIRRDNSVDCHNLGANAESYCNMSVSRHKKRMCDKVNGWAQESIDGDIGALFKWIEKEDVREKKPPRKTATDIPTLHSLECLKRKPKNGQPYG